MTYTYVRYFTEDSLEPIRAALQALLGDADSRAPYIDPDAGDAIRRRLGVIEAAIDLLAEPVPQAFGG